MRTVCLFVLLCVSALSYGAKKYKLVEISTNLGNIKIKLYENTPRHSENFLKLVKAHHYDSLLFHRVIGDFMIQGGSSDSRHAPKETAVGMSNPGYTIEAGLGENPLPMEQFSKIYKDNVGILLGGMTELE